MTGRIGDSASPSSSCFRSDDDPDRRDSYGVPNWDQWVVYRVTREEKGQLLRHAVQPAGGSGRQLLRKADGLDQMAGTVALHDLSWARVSAPQILARGVRSLEISLDQQLRGVNFAITLEQPTSPENPKNDVVTATFFIKPHNTVPAE